MTVDMHGTLTVIAVNQKDCELDSLRFYFTHLKLYMDLPPFFISEFKSFSSEIT